MLYFFWVFSRVQVVFTHTYNFICFEGESRRQTNPHIYIQHTKSRLARGTGRADFKSHTHTQKTKNARTRSICLCAIDVFFLLLSYSKTYVFEQEKLSWTTSLGSTSPSTKNEMFPRCVDQRGHRTRSRRWFSRSCRVFCRCVFRRR